MTTRELRFRFTLENGQFLSGLAESNNGLGNLQRSASSISFGEMARGAATLTGIALAARAVADAITSIPTKGISFLAETEVTQLGMAGILQSMTEINGQATTFTQAQAMAAGSVERLQRAAAETSASSGDLVNTFRALLGPALAAGMTMEQVERLSVVGANAVKSMGMTTGQIVQEMRDLVQGGITASGSTLATSLGLKDEDIQKAKRSTEGLYSFLMQRMEGFKSTSDAYAMTLKGGWEALEEQVTQASARAMAPAADAAKGAIREISEALKGGEAVSALNGIGQGAASAIGMLSSGIGIAQQYGGAIQAIALAYGAIKIGSVAAQFAQVTAAKIEGAAASRLAATQAVLSAEADAVETQSSRAKLAALIAEERTKVQALATEAAVTAAKLRSAEASAAQLVGMQRLQAVETQVLPLRQQHATQTAALEQAQQRLSAATTAASTASRAMGAVVGALGGPIGIAIAAISLLTMGIMSARAEAEKLGKTKVSVERIEETLNKGGKVDSLDASRVRSTLDDAKEKRDALLAESRKPASMYDRSKGILGGDSNVEARAKALAEAEKEVKKYEAITNRIDESAQAQQKAELDVALRGGVSSKGLNEMLAGVKTANGIKEEGAEKIKALEKAAADERALMIKRNANAAELAAFDEKIGAAKSGMRRNTTLELQGLEKKETRAAGGGGESSDSKAAQLEKASADLRLAQLKQDSASRSAVLDDELQRADALHQRGLTGVEEYEAERLRIRGEKLTERLALIDAEIGAENKRAPKTDVERVNRQKRVVELITERNTVTTDIKAGETGAAAATAARELERQRAEAAETVQLWQQASTQITQLRGQNSQAAVGMITDPVSKMRAETAAQVSALKASADELTKSLELKIGITTDPGQREMLRAQVEGIAEETSRAIELANSGLTERMKPGWQTMLEGWRDTTRLMREASDQAMSGMLSKAEDGFVNFRKTGKINIEGMVSDWVDGQMRMQFRKFMGGETGGKITDGLSNLLGGKPGGKEDASLVGPVMPEAVGKLRDSAGDASAQLRDAAAEGGSLASSLDAVGRSLGGFGGDVMRAGSALLSMLQSAGSAGGSSGGGLGSLIGAGLKAWFGGGAGGGADFVGPMPQALGGVFTGARRFAAGASFANQIVDRETPFRFADGGTMQLGIMGEAGPEAIMPLSGGGAMAIGVDGRKLGHVPVQRGPGGRLAVVLDGASTARRFATGGAFGGAVPTLTRGASDQLKAAAAPAAKAGDLAIDASTTLQVMDMNRVQQMVAQASMSTERRIYEHLRAVGAMR